MEKNLLKTKAVHYGFHFFAYYLVWAICIYSAAYGFRWFGLIASIAITLVQYLWQMLFKKQHRHLIIFIIYLTIIGCVGDTALCYLNIIQYKANPFIFPLPAPFMIGIWLNFAMLYYATLTWFTTRPFMLSLLSFVGFVFAYLIGASIGAAVLLKGALSLVLIGLIWAIVLPISIAMFNKRLPLPKESE